jgi:hypothetical protein
MTNKDEDWDFEAEWRKVQRRVRADLRRARAAGVHWTPYRKFIGFTEAVGKMVCHTPGRKHKATGSTRARAIYVSYCTMISGCTVKCEECYQKLLKNERRPTTSSDRPARVRSPRASTAALVRRAAPRARRIS